MQFVFREGGYVPESVFFNLGVKKKCVFPVCRPIHRFFRQKGDSKIIFPLNHKKKNFSQKNAFFSKKNTTPKFFFPKKMRPKNFFPQKMKKKKNL